MTARRMSRRRFGAIAVGGFASVVPAAGCTETFNFGVLGGRLRSRPGTNGTTRAAPGDRALGVEKRRDAMLHVPAHTNGKPLPLLVLLHGASGSGEGVLGRLGAAIADSDVAVLAPSSRDGTWDGIRGGFGPDVMSIDLALERVFDTVAVDQARVAVGGFSDGATYALSLGLINGDLFSRIVAFSPGFVVDGEPHGRPRIFVSHGTSDEILPIDRASRTIEPELRRRGYDVTFREFDGGHEVPAAIARDALAWITGDQK